MISAAMQNTLRFSWRHNAGIYDNMPPLKIVEGRKVKRPKRQVHDDGVSRDL
jgi:hypothetical protein